MQIKQIAKRSTDTRTGLPLFGILNKGAKRTQEMLDRQQPGPDLDFFRVEYMPRWEGHVRIAFEALFGLKPIEFAPVIILGATPEVQFENYRCQRAQNGNRIVLKCDGEQIYTWLDEKRETHPKYLPEQMRYEDFKPCPGGNEHGGCTVCSYEGWLNVLIPQLCIRLDQPGYFRLRTGAQRDIANIAAVLHRAAEMPGVVPEHVPYRLGRQEERAGWRNYTDKRDGKLKTAEVKKWFLYLEPMKTGGQVAASLAAKAGLADWLAGLGSPQLGGVDASQPQLPDGALAGQPDALNAGFSQDVEDGVIVEDDSEIVTETYHRCKRIDIAVDKDGNHSFHLICDDGRRFTVLAPSTFHNAGWSVVEVKGWMTHRNHIVTPRPAIIVCAAGDQVIELRQEQP